MHRHEHHYVDLSDHIVESSELFQDGDSVGALLGTSQIILCTVAMLSNPSMDSFGVFRRIPVEQLVVDEASQIDTAEFLVGFHPYVRRDLADTKP